MGIKLVSKDLDLLFSQGKLKYGYLREPYWFDEKYTGLCALTKDFDLCRFPRVLNWTEENNCIYYLNFKIVD